MKTLETQVREFYSDLKFPGPYSIDDLRMYDQGLHNRFLIPYDRAVSNARSVLDVGCGSGFITNLLAHRYPNTNFVALDFSDSIDYAKNFAQTHELSNIKFIKQDFLTLQLRDKFDVIICNGVLHHMPNHARAIDQINHLLDDHGNLVVGVYNRYGKIFQKRLAVNWRSDILRADQELVPYETSFTHKETIKMFPNMELKHVYPSLVNHLVDFLSIFNYHNGCLTVYSFTKTERK